MNINESELKWACDILDKDEKEYAMIPNSFECMGFTINVHTTTELKKNIHGKWEPSTQQILIRWNDTFQMQEQTFWHEAVHCILDNLSYDELSHDENFVDRFAQCLYQLEKTREVG